MIKHFGLKSLPFTREIQIKERVKFPFIEAESDALLSAIKCRMSSALIAPAGSGKTLVLRTIKKSLPEARYRVHYVKVTGVSKRDMCREISTAIGAKPAGNYPMLVRAIQEHLEASLNVDGLRPVMLIDECHDMPPQVLDMLRLLTNFSMDSKLVVSLVLAGQPPLRALLQKESLGQSPAVWLTVGACAYSFAQKVVSTWNTECGSLDLLTFPLMKMPVKRSLNCPVEI